MVGSSAVLIGCRARVVGSSAVLIGYRARVVGSSAVFSLSVVFSNAHWCFIVSTTSAYLVFDGYVEQNFTCVICVVVKLV